MTKQSLPTVSSLTRDSLEGFKTADKVVLVGYFAADDEASIVSFTTVAEMLRHSYLFGVVTDANLAMAEDVSIPSVILYKAFDEGKSIFSHSIDVEAVYKFAITASIPLVGEVLPETHPGYIATGIPLAYIFAETEEERFKLGTALKPVAEKYRSAVIFTTIDAKVFGAYADDLKLQVHKWPAFAIQDTVSNKAFPYDQDAKITAELIGKFVQDFIDGKIEPTIKSEPIPEKQQGPVQVVVAKNYNIIVLDDSKDAIIEFYAPWCNHCKAFAPSYDILAALYTEQGHSEKVTIAKVDATANDIPEEIMDFPTIKLYKAGDKSNPVTYRGNRTIRDLIRFIEESGKHGVSVTYVEEKPAESEARQAEASTESVSKELKESATGATKAEESHDEL
jgi:protein disulfide-isomerase A1